MSTKDDDPSSDSDDVLIEDDNGIFEGIIEDNKPPSPSYGFKPIDDNVSSDSNVTQISEMVMFEPYPLDNTFAQNRLWSDMCPIDGYPTLKVMLNEAGSGIMGVRKDCYRCKRSFKLNEDCKFEEVPFVTDKIF
jgi:hypothetical protein